MKLKLHLWTLPRWFAAPFFGCSALFGSVLAGDLGLNAWLATIGALLLMAGGHSFNTLLDYSWTGLDRGEADERSAEKGYCGGQSVIAAGVISEKEVLWNGLSWYLLAAIVIGYLIIVSSLWLIPIALAGAAVTVWYSISKFTYIHELALGVAVGPLPVLLGMYAVNPDPPIVAGLLVSVPFAIILSFLGLALDEWPDAEANLKKGVKSIAYRVWQYNISLEWYCSVWLLSLYIYQLFLIQLGVIKPLTGMTFIVLPVIIMLLVPLRSNFRKVMTSIVGFAALYPLLLILGQVFG